MFFLFILALLIVHHLKMLKGKFLAKKLKAVKYVECSAFNQKRVKNVFDESILAALKIRQQSEQKKNSNKFYL
jgi:hypothetical protein